MDGKQMNKNMLGIGTMLFVLTLIFSVGTASAIGPIWTANPGWDAPDIGYDAAPAFADLDGDGDYDLLIGESDGVSCAYENTAPPAELIPECYTSCSNIGAVVPIFAKEKKGEIEGVELPGQKLYSFFTFLRGSIKIKRGNNE